MRSRIFSKITDFISAYDPGYVDLIHSLKVFSASIIGSFLCIWLFGDKMFFWGAMIPVLMYFLRISLKDQREVYFYFTAFLVSSVFYILTLPFIAPFGWALMITLIIIAFITALINAYSYNLYKALSFGLVNGLVASIYSTAILDTSVILIALSVIVSGILAMAIYFFLSFRRYKKFNQKYFVPLLLELEILVANLNRPIVFSRVLSKANKQILEIKKSLGDRTNQSKHSKASKRSLFYLYRLEDIKECISTIENTISLGDYDDKFIAKLKRELDYNLHQARKLFKGGIPRFKCEVLKSIDANLESSLKNLLKVIHTKLVSLTRSARESNYMLETSVKKKRGLFSTLKKALDSKNEHFRYALKYSLSIGLCLLVAGIFNLHNGIWVTMACLQFIKPNTGEVKSAGLEYFFGAALGLPFGIAFVYLLYGDVLFIFLLAFVFFLFIYFRMFPHVLWAAIWMVMFVMVFSLFGPNYFQVLGRLVDIFIALAVTLVVFWIIYPRNGGSDFVPKLKACLDNLCEFYGFLSKNIQALESKHEDFIALQNDFIASIEGLQESIKISKSERKSIKNTKVAEAISKQLVYLHHSGLRIYYHLISRGVESKKELYVNDLNIIHTRYSMLKKSMDKEEFYFKENEDGRFVSEDADFTRILKGIFGIQNKLFLNIAAIA